MKANLGPDEMDERVGKAKDETSRRCKSCMMRTHGQVCRTVYLNEMSNKFCWSSKASIQAESTKEQHTIAPRRILYWCCTMSSSASMCCRICNCKENEWSSPSFAPFLGHPSDTEKTSRSPAHSVYEAEELSVEIDSPALHSKSGLEADFYPNLTCSKYVAWLAICFWAST